MNWLATKIPSLRDFYTAPKALYTPEGPYTTHSVFTRGAAACRLHLNNKNTLHYSRPLKGL